MVTFKIISYIVAVLWFFGVLRWDVYNDYKKWKEGIPVKHRKEAILRGLLLSVTLTLLIWPKLHADVWQWHSLWVILLTIGLVGGIWWLLFDGWYNKIRGFKWGFDGSVDKDDSWLDWILYHVNDTIEMVAKLVIIVCCGIGYIAV